MTRRSRFARRALVFACATISIAGSPGCGSPYLRTGYLHQQRGELAIAVEAFAAGLAETPENAELREAYVAAAQLYEVYLRREQELLTTPDTPALGLGRAFEIEQLARTCATYGLCADETPARQRERQQAEDQIADLLSRDLDRRLSRGHDDSSDLIACQRTAAFRPDATIARTCERLRSRFRMIAKVRTAGSSHPETPHVASTIERLVRTANCETFEIVSEDNALVNASLVLDIGNREERSQPWTLSLLERYHTWVPKRDGSGNQVEEVVSREPSPADIEKANREGKKKPGPKEEKKKVWEQVEGTYREYSRSRTVMVPYSVTLIDERMGAIIFALTGIAEAESTAHYHEYEGDRRAKTSSYKGAPQPTPLEEPSVLESRALDELAERLARRILEKIES